MIAYGGGRAQLFRNPEGVTFRRRDTRRSTGLRSSGPEAFPGLARPTMSCRAAEPGRRSESGGGRPKTADPGASGARSRELPPVHRAPGPTGYPGTPFPGGVVEAAGIEPASEGLPQRPLHAYPGCVGRRARERPPRSPPPRINPANRGMAAIPGVSRTVRESRPSSPPGRRPFPSRQARSGRTWLKQPEPSECRWRLCVFHRLRKVDPRHAVAASCTFVEPSTPPPALLRRVRFPVPEVAARRSAHKRT